ncbi:putative camphor resistance CrcB protein [Phytophthora cinnamomi]|uniref:putative camphor resistance CrcB protein n=1 Tax=Phytophthora cinnamomi TaxID=4785 RepID=UPI00355A6CD5|nr:putative camphor resistance CrcB protein [Phytophthora cinnamomi]
MQTISEDFVPLSTPGASAPAPGPASTSAHAPDSSTSSTEYGGELAVPVEQVHLSEDEVAMASDRSLGAASEQAWTREPRSSLDRYVPVVASVVIGAYFGVGARVLLTEFADVMYASQTELLELLGFGYFLPNVLGCFVMGVATRIKPVLRGQHEVLLTGVTTGFCGCCTTFASWDLGAALMFVHGRWLNAVLMLCVQVASAMVSLRAGFHVAEGIVHHLTLQEYPFRKPPVNLGQLNLDLERNINHFREIKMHTFGPLVARRVRATEDSLAIARDSCSELMAEIIQVEHEQYPVHHHNAVWVTTALFLTAIFWVLAFCGFDNYPSSRLLALCFGPFGALLRWYLSLYNSKPMCKAFPLFTFVPNVVASCLSCAMEIVGSVTFQDSASAYRHFVMFGQGGVMVGFLGSLSTVSTWVNELDGLSSRRLYWAYRYGFTSVIVSQAASAFILGMYDAYGSDPLIG